MIALDLFCGAGGAGEGLRRAGFEVIGVDIAPQPNYKPGRFIQANALDVVRDLLVGGDFVPWPNLVWASPPCQRYSAATRQTGRATNHPDLVPPTRDLLVELGVPYVIENVLGAPLVDPIMLCGAMFELGVIRHRLFECSWPIERPPHPKHRGSLVTGEYVTVAGNGGVPAWTLKERERRGLPRHRAGEYSLENWSRAMGIDWMSRLWLGVSGICAISATEIAEIPEIRDSQSMANECDHAEWCPACPFCCEEAVAIAVPPSDTPRRFLVAAFDVTGLAAHEIEELILRVSTQTIDDRFEIGAIAVGPGIGS